ncbi:MAG: hypothetical protein WA484_13305 [Solirubrobacteraceae bacterium]
MMLPLRDTKSLLPVALFMSTALALTAVGWGCGGTGNVPTQSADRTAASSTATSGAYRKDDGDQDTDDHGNSTITDNQSFLATYGKQAGPADTRTIAALVKSYYAAAAAGDSAKACTLLDASLYASVAEGQSPSAGAGGCAATLAPILAREHAQLTADDVSTMVVTSVHVSGNVGVAAVGFRKTPENAMLVKREGNVWKVDVLIGGDMT